MFFQDLKKSYCFPACQFSIQDFHFDIARVRFSGYWSKVIERSLEVGKHG